MKNLSILKDISNIAIMITGVVVMGCAVIANLISISNTHSIGNLNYAGLNTNERGVSTSRYTTSSGIYTCGKGGFGNSLTFSSLDANKKMIGQTKYFYNIIVNIGTNLCETNLLRMGLIRGQKASTDSQSHATMPTSVHSHIGAYNEHVQQLLYHHACVVDFEC